jgi:hypothetical protein
MKNKRERKAIREAINLREMMLSDHESELKNDKKRLIEVQKTHKENVAELRGEIRVDKEAIYEDKITLKYLRKSIEV